MHSYQFKVKKEKSTCLWNLNPRITALDVSSSLHIFNVHNLSSKKLDLDGHYKEIEPI